MKKSILITFLLVGLCALPVVKGSDEEHLHGMDASQHEESSHEHDDEHDEEKATHIDNNMAKQVGLVTSQVTSQKLQQTIIVYGSLSTGPEQLSHVRARYSGLVKSVSATIGDQVNANDLLAQVESNESLKAYQVRAPITGTVIQRHANKGEVTQEQVLFTIANFDTLWAEFRVYPSLQSMVKPGQAAHIVANDIELEGTIQHVIPVLDKPYQLARIAYDNRTQGLTPGLLVEGHIIVGEFFAPLAVTKDAIQTLEGKPGVFVKNEDEYVFTPLVLGRKDDQFVEVISGLRDGQLYVSKNSYLLKADIEKSEAEHEH